MFKFIEKILDLIFPPVCGICNKKINTYLCEKCEKEINKTIFKQLLYFVAIPMILPIIISIPTILIVSQIFTIAVTTEEILKNVAIVVGMLILVYGIYFIATDVQFNRNINGD